MGVPAVLDRNQQKEQNRKRKAVGDEPDGAIRKRRPKTIESQVYGYGREVMPQFPFDYPVVEGVAGVWNQVPPGTDGDLYLKEYTNYVGFLIQVID